MVSETRRPAVGGHEVRINCASWMNRATINHGTLLGAPIRSTPNMLKLPYARISGDVHLDSKTKPQVGLVALCLKENGQTTQQC